jgi:hypothetical protein
VYVKDDKPAPTTTSPATLPRRRRIRQVKPVTFLCPSVPALGLGLPSNPNQAQTFQNGRLTLSDPRDIEAVRRHGWFGSRIVMETPEVLARLEADAALHRQLQRKHQELADEAHAKQAMAGPKEALIDWAKQRS